MKIIRLSVTGILTAAIIHIVSASTKMLEIDLISDSLIELNISSSQYLLCNCILFNFVKINIHHSFYLMTPKYQYFGFEAGVFRDLCGFQGQIQGGFKGRYSEGIRSFWLLSGVNCRLFEERLLLAMQVVLSKTAREWDVKPCIGISYLITQHVAFAGEYAPKNMYQQDRNVFNIGMIFLERWLSVKLYVQTDDDLYYIKTRSMIAISFSVSFFSPSLEH